MYPIINLRNHKMDLHWYLRSLEEVVIRTLSSTFSIKASRVEGLTGVWVGMLLDHFCDVTIDFLHGVFSSTYLLISFRTYSFSRAMHETEC